MQPFSNPLMPSHFQAWCEPPMRQATRSSDRLGGAPVSSRGIPSANSIATSCHCWMGGAVSRRICAETADLFNRADLESALSLLAAHNIVVEGDNRPAGPQRLQPQLGYFHEVAGNADEAQRPSPPRASSCSVLVAPALPSCTPSRPQASAAFRASTIARCRLPTPTCHRLSVLPMSVACVRLPWPPGSVTPRLKSPPTR